MTLKVFVKADVTSSSVTKPASVSHCCHQLCMHVAGGIPRYLSTLSTTFSLLYRATSQQRLGLSTMSRHTFQTIAVAVLLYGAAAASAQNNNTNLCSCTDLLWKPQPSSAWEVVNWHNKLVAELSAARPEVTSTLIMSSAGLGTL